MKLCQLQNITVSAYTLTASWLWLCTCRIITHMWKAWLVINTLDAFVCYPFHEYGPWITHAEITQAHDITWPYGAFMSFWPSIHIHTNTVTMGLCSNLDDILLHGCSDHSQQLYTCAHYIINEIKSTQLHFFFYFHVRLVFGVHAYFTFPNNGPHLSSVV